MGNVKRWYILLTSFISLNSFVWAVITLLRDLLTRGTRIDSTGLAFQIAVIIISFPVFLIHWLWAQRLAAENMDERVSMVRGLYLYVILASSLGPLLANLFRIIVDQVVDTRSSNWISNLIPIVIMAGIYFYHYKQKIADNSILGRESSPEARRWYLMGFNLTGLVMTINASLNLLVWLFFRFSTSGTIGSSWISRLSRRGISTEVVRLLFGVAIWVFFWKWMQNLFTASDEEQQSKLRKVYLYLIVFITAVTTISTVTGILASGIRRVILRGGPPFGDIREALPVVIIMGLVWAFHAYVLRNDDAAVGTVSSQDEVRRIYLYLVGSIGLVALIVGLVGILNIFILVLSKTGTIQSDFGYALSWSVAGLFAGIPSWVLPWRIVQEEAIKEGVKGMESRRSNARKIYLYLFLFIAVMTLLGALIYIVFQLLLLLFGERTTMHMGRDLSITIADSIIALGVLIYHGMLLRADGRIKEAEKTAKLKEIKMTLIDSGEGNFGVALKENLAIEIPGLMPTYIGISSNAKEAMKTELEEKDILGHLGESQLIISSWRATTIQEDISPKITEAIATSPAHRIILPQRAPGVDWVGLGKLDPNTHVSMTITAIKQYIDGNEIITKRGMGCSPIIAGIIAVFVSLQLLLYAANAFF